MISKKQYILASQYWMDSKDLETNRFSGPSFNDDFRFKSFKVFGKNHRLYGFANFFARFYWQVNNKNLLSFKGSSNGYL